MAEPDEKGEPVLGAKVVSNSAFKDSFSVCSYTIQNFSKEVERSRINR
jgi:hypothetical protein